MMLLDTATEADLTALRPDFPARPHDRLAAARRHYRHAVAVVARADGVSPRLVARPIGRAHRRRRYWAIYLAVVRLQVPIRVAARVAGCDRRIVRRALRQIEDARDRPDIDRAITRLEERLA